MVLGCVLLGASIWLFVWSGFRGDGVRLIGRSIGLLLPVAAFPILRKRAVRSAMHDLGAIRAPSGSLRDTRTALSDFSVARGRAVPDLWVFTSESINAIAYREKGAERIAVTSTFAMLPVNEQRAGIGMLLSRDMVNLDSIVVGSKYGIPCTPSDLTDPAIRAKVTATWSEVAAAADRQALMLLREPAPMLTLLKRLASATTFLPLRSLDAGYGCLAWPFIPAAETGADSELPLKARVALAAIMPARPGAIVSPELVRYARLQDVLPAAERVVADPEPLVSRPLFESAVSATGPSARPEPGPRVARWCPSCGASNVATNHACIACGKTLPANAH